MMIELDTILWARMRSMMERIRSLERKLQDPSPPSSIVSLRKVSEIGKLIGLVSQILGALWRTWPLLLALGVAIWQLMQPVLRWLRGLLSHVLAWVGS